jgi:TonB family protein
MKLVCFRYLRSAAIAAVFLLAATGIAAAQATPDGPAPDAATPAAPGGPAPAAPAAAPAGVTLPKLVKFVEAVWPPGTLEQGLTAVVDLKISIAVDGSVKDVQVVTPAGNGFDEAAVAAAKQFVFEPARKNGVAMAARIPYQYVFEMQKAEPVPEPDAPPLPGRLEGSVLAIEDDTALAGVRVIVAMPDGSNAHQTSTGPDGSFAVDALPAGPYSVRIEREGRVAREQQEEVLAGQATTVTYRMQEPRDPDAFGAVARIPPPPREVTRRTIAKEQLTRIPGTRGDALRTVELMPGVARPPLGAGLLIVRGSAPADTQPLLEGVPVALLYHFGGLTSFINSRLLKSVDFYPGNFSVRYGRRRGGIIEVGLDDIKNDAPHGVADINLLDASLLFTFPVSEDAEVALAFRRSYFDAVFTAVAEGSDIQTVAAPVYYDYQVMGTWRPTDRDKLRLMVYGSSDNLELLFEQPVDGDSSVAGDFAFGTQFHRVHGSWRRQLSKDVDQDVDIAVGEINADFGLGEAFKFNLSGTEIYARSEWRGRVSEKVRLIGGLDLFFLPGEYLYQGPAIGQSEGNPDNMGAPFGNRDEITESDDFTVIQPAVYLETDINLFPVRFNLGSRVDYYDEIQEWSYDPRGSAHLTVTETTTLKAGIGMFSQPPQFQETSPGLGNPDLEPTSTLHVGAGAEQKIWDNVTLGVDGFYKHLYDNIVGTASGNAPFFTNDGEGRIYGMEVSAKVDPGENGRFFGYLSYTLSRSERNDRGEGWRLFDFDQPHIATIAAVWRLGRGWEAGGTFRLVSGNPETPIIGSRQNTTTGLYSPIYGGVNSDRAPSFNRLDLRVEKEWRWPDWKLALYLDVQNVYNAENPEGTIYDYRYDQKTAIRGLPIIPNIGLRGEI